MDTEVFSPRLFIAGYSFGDLYLNQILNRITRLHGDSRRIVIVDFFPGLPDEFCWHCDAQILSQDHNWTSDEMYQFLSIASKSESPLGRSLRFRSPLFSDDRCCRLYLKGMNDALQNHGDEIIEFLMS